MNVGQSELRLPRRIETSGAKPQSPKHSSDQQQQDQQPSEDKRLNLRDSASIYTEKDTGETTLAYELQTIILNVSQIHRRRTRAIINLLRLGFSPLSSRLIGP